MGAAAAAAKEGLIGVAAEASGGEVTPSSSDLNDDSLQVSAWSKDGWGE